MKIGNLQIIKLFAKQIGLPNRSKFRKKQLLFDAIENFLTSQKPTISRKELEKYSAIKLREFASKHNISGWSKDRKKKVKIDKIFSGGSI